MYSLQSFKGKVILVDLWASWCGPCRQEIPHLKKIIDKYKNNSNIEFISIAVHDNDADWRKALLSDKPGGLQLFDKDGKVQNAYVARSIPKYVLISKQGNIVSFDTPMPSDAENLEKMLNEEMAK